MSARAAVHYAWRDVPAEAVTPMLNRRLVTGERVMLAEVTLAKGCLVPGHRHEHEQLTQVMRGALKFWVGDNDAEELVLREGEVLHLPSNVWHRAESLEESVVLDVFSPPREDWLNRTDSYLRAASHR
jgi:unsaturated pyranuronate lyase